MGSYENQTIITNPFSGKKVGIDNCILNEVTELWKHGIETIESCCGHNAVSGYVAVKEQFIERMTELGYVHDKGTESIGCFVTSILKDGNNTGT